MSSVVTGWGRNVSSTPEESVPFVSTLQEITLPITSTATCNTFFDSLLPEEQQQTTYPGYLCVGDGQERGTCYGDSGGPIIIQKTGQTRSETD